MSPADRCRSANTIEPATTSSLALFLLLQRDQSSRTRGLPEEKEEVTMDTSENRPENDVPEPPMPIADQVSNDDRPEGSAEDEEKKELSLLFKSLMEPDAI
ncbi:Apoptotic chromatin condensation inducer in the nucleus [Plecturocebus cupreus]